MDVLVVYFSVSGNTAEIARAMGDQARALGHSVDVKPLKAVAVADLDAYDVVFIGSACHSSDVAEPVKTLLSALPHAPAYMLAGFVTHSTMMAEHPVHGHYYERWAGQCLLTFERTCADKGIAFKGYFHCQGRPSEPIAQFIHNTIIPDEAEFTDYMADIQAHPDAQDVKDAQSFVEKVLGT